MKQAMVTAYVEKLLAEVTGNDKVTPDQDGDYPVRFGDALYFVRVGGNDETPVVQVFSIAISEMPAKAKLFEAINDINAAVRFARCFWRQGQVVFGTELLAETLDPQELENAAVAVASASDHFTPELMEKFGGRPFFEEAKEDESAEKPSGAPSPDGGYL